MEKIKPIVIIMKGNQSIKIETLDTSEIVTKEQLFDSKEGSSMIFRRKDGSIDRYLSILKNNSKEGYVEFSIITIRDEGYNCSFTRIEDEDYIEPIKL